MPNRIKPPAVPLNDQMLEALLGKPIKVFLVNGKALDGILQKYDKKSLIVSPETLIEREHVTTFYPDNIENEKATCRKESTLRRRRDDRPLNRGGA